MSGDIAKLFRHEEQKAPGVFAIDPPSAAATLLAREVIQNSWDAARELQSIDSNAPQFEIEFRFQKLLDGARRSVVETLHLQDLAARISQIDRSKVGLSNTDCLATVADPRASLPVLRITERAASGMYGPWRQNKSHMFRALLSIGFTDKMTGSGGTYGYGKAGLINGSRVRTVVAYSCFREREDDPGVTRRLLGVTYWGPHDLDGKNYPGIGTLSAGSAGSIRPFENEHADQVAEALGLEVRDPAKTDDLGTSFLLVDPTVTATELVRAIERSWWPALQEDDFVATVITDDGRTLPPRPMQDPVLHTFIDAWEIAMRRSAPRIEDKFSRLTGPDDPFPGAAGKIATVGTLALVSDMTGWSYADQTAGPESDVISHRSLVALTRGPRMVVEYLEVGHSPPYLRGAFIADDSIDDILRRTEPKAHDSWQKRAQPGEVDLDAAAVAAHVDRRIRQTVQNHRARLRPPAPSPEEVNLPFFNDVMRKVMTGMGGGVRQPVPDTRPISIRLVHEPRESGIADLIELAGSATFALSEHCPSDQAKAVLTIAYRFIEDDRVGEHSPLRINPAQGFIEKEQGVFVGRLLRGQEARFDFVSTPYEQTWSGRLIVDGEVEPDKTDEVASE